MQKANYWRIKSLTKGIEVLRAINRQPGGIAGSAELAAVTGMHRTTVKRLVETLRLAGLVECLPGTGQYCLTHRVRELSEGFRDEHCLPEIAAPLLGELTRKILWPSGLVVPERGRLLVRHSTYRDSCLAMHPSMLGKDIPFLRTASGRAYLAFCSREERGLLLDVLRTRADEEGMRARDHARVNALLDGIQRAGLAVNDGEWVLSGRFAAIAVPVRSGGRVIACLNVVFSKRSVSPRDAVHRWGRDLATTARLLERAFSAWRNSQEARVKCLA